VTDDTRPITARLAILERRNTAWTTLGVAASFIAMVAGASAFRAAGPNHTIEAERLILRDPSGSSRTVTLSISKSGGLQAEFGGRAQPMRGSAEIVIYDETGREVARLGAPAVRQVHP
jgi:hypothetical protein